MKSRGLLLIIFIFAVVLISGCIQENLTPEHVLQEKDLLLGERISVEGTADVYRMICTLIACEPENPCCNACGGNLALKGQEEKIMVHGDYEGKDVGCAGNNCNQTCYPLEKEKRYIVTGTWRKDYGEYYLELEDFQGF